MVKRGSVFYYSDETKDDFQDTKTALKRTVDGNYKYNRSKAFDFFSGILYYGIVVPLLLVFTYLIKGVRVYGRKNARKLKKSGYFIYANHTNVMDSFMGHVNIALPKRTYIIANKDAIEIPVVDKIVKMLGCLPVPDTAMGLKNLDAELKNLIEKKKAIMVYPEAHIWHFYTGVRPFPLTSFKFAAKFSAPALPVAVKYRKRLIGRPAMTVYIGEPIYPNSELSVRENAEILRDGCYNFVKSKVEEKDNYRYCEYVKREAEQVADLNAGVTE